MFSRHDGLDLVPPRQASNICPPRHPLCKSSAAALKADAMLRQQQESMFKNSSSHVKRSGWASGMGLSDTFTEKAFMAKAMALLSAPHEEKRIFHYGTLPPQVRMGRGDEALDQIHPVDQVDAILPNSLVQMERKKKAKTAPSRRVRVHQEVKPWDSTGSRVTDALLWRRNENLI
jgi:hypothetical protein